MSSRFVLTDHAIEQLVTRYDRTLGHEDAKLLLETAIAEKVLLLPERTLSGEDQWHLPGLGIVLVTKRRKDKNVVVTVVQEHHIQAVREQKRVELEAVVARPQVTRVTNDGVVNTLTFEVQLDYTVGRVDDQEAQNIIFDYVKTKLGVLRSETRNSKTVKIRDAVVRLK